MGWVGFFPRSSHSQALQNNCSGAHNAHAAGQSSVRGGFLTRYTIPKGSTARPRINRWWASEAPCEQLCSEDEGHPRAISLARSLLESARSCTLWCTENAPRCCSAQTRSCRRSRSSRSPWLSQPRTLGLCHPLEGELVELADLVEQPVVVEAEDPHRRLATHQAPLLAARVALIALHPASHLRHKHLQI